MCVCVRERETVYNLSKCLQCTIYGKKPHIVQELYRTQPNASEIFDLGRWTNIIWYKNWEHNALRARMKLQYQRPIAHLISFLPTSAPHRFPTILSAFWIVPCRADSDLPASVGPISTFIIVSVHSAYARDLCVSLMAFRTMIFS